VTSKLASLESAVRDALEPGLRLHLTTSGRAATREVLRQSAGTDLGITLIMCRVGGGHAADLVASGSIAAVIAGSYGAFSSSYVGPMPQLQATFGRGDVTFEHWSFLSLIQRLQAAAHGLPFAQTHSLIGSSMAAANAADFMVITDPFGQPAPAAIMRPLVPDVSVVHALATDEDGNTIVIPPQEDGVWGALASRHGAIVTAEHIVSRHTIRKNSHLVRLPGRYVRAVCHVPFGAHPGPFGSRALANSRIYQADRDFDDEYIAASREPGQLRQWLERWVFGLASHDAYLAQLGQARLDELQRPGSPGRDPGGTRAARQPPPPGAAPASANETVMSLATREAVSLVRTGGHDVVLVGAGLSEVAAVAARQVLRESGIYVSLAMGHGFFGFEPTPGQSEPDATVAVMSGDGAEIYGVILGGSRPHGLALLGAAQIDRHGNLNSTVVNGKLFTGSGGSNDAASVCDTIVVTGLSRRKLVDQVEYVTCPGTRVRALVTDRGIFRKERADSPLRLCAYVAEDTTSAADAIARIKAGCGWELEIAARLERIPVPAGPELSLIRRLMPDRYH
jgi:acyl CoA:acetate/3-ketoacid CoA transferase beta subunit/acyl CoA:acetate/3-ketoacid CoA transferase alpha subunit